MTNLVDRQLFLQRVRSRVGQGYVYGTYFSAPITLARIDAKRQQYPDQFARRLTFNGVTKTVYEWSQEWIGEEAGDCVGLIKAGYWTDDTGRVRYRYLDRADVSADGMLRMAKVKGPISTMPDIPGLFVHFPGHIGIYIGNGEVVEARGVYYGVVITKLKNRPWTSWGQVPYVDYSEVDSMQKIYEGVQSGLVATGLWQSILVALGYDLGRYGPNNDGVDESFGPTTGRQTIQFKKDYGVSYTTATATVVDASVYKAAVAALKSKQGNVSKKELEAAQAQVSRLETERKALEKDLQTLAAARKVLDKYQ